MSLEEKKPCAYVDGSFNPQKGKYAFGLVAFHPGGEVEEFCGSGNSAEALKQRNVSGEMIAAMLSVKWAIVNGYKELTIYYDYAGIEAWVSGAWKAKNELTMKYRDTMRTWGTRVAIRFEKVEAHTGNKFNERADELAKEGLEKEVGLPDITKLKQE